MRALREDAPGARHHPHRSLDLLTESFELGEVAAEDLDPDGSADPRREHVDPSADRHRPGVRHPGHPDGGVHLCDESVAREPGAPLRFRVERDGRLEHVESRRIGRRLRASRLAPDALDLGERLEHGVLRLEDPARARDAHARQRRRHEEDRALVEPRHELAPELRPGDPGEDQRRHRADDHRGTVAEHDADQGSVAGDEHPVHRVGALATDAPAHEQRHGHRHQRDGEQRRSRHREGLGERQRPEEPAFLSRQPEDRDERDGDDEEGEEERRPHLARRLDDDPQSFRGAEPRGVDVRGSRVHARALPFPLEMLVDVLDHHDRRVDHRPDRDGDPTE